MALLIGVFQKQQEGLHVLVYFVFWKTAVVPDMDAYAAALFIDFFAQVEADREVRGRCGWTEELLWHCKLITFEFFPSSFDT